MGRRGRRLGGGWRVCALLVAAYALACSQTTWEARLATPAERDELDHQAPFMKVHTHDGGVYVLESWRFVDDPERVIGEGLYYGVYRRKRTLGPHEIPMDEVALLETNRPKKAARAGGVVLGVMTGVTAGLAATCMAVPKLCFGSCPTFYAYDGERLALQAEGFSASVLRTLEETDVDSLHTARPEDEDGRFEVVMRNEALETHLVREVQVLAVPREGGRRVIRVGERFHDVRRTLTPRRCDSPRGECTRAVAERDGVPHAPRTDPHDLGARDSVVLRFDSSTGRRGLLIAARNSLVQTFLFYQLLSYLGHDVGEWIRAVERGELDGAADAARALRELGDITVEARVPGGEWTHAGIFDEVGPIAQDVRAVALPPDLPDGEIEVRLRFTRGYWKLDRLALVELGDERAPRRIRPARLRRGDAPAPGAMAALRDPNRHLVTYPRDEYRLVFEIPEGDHELFLRSTGYYYEWMRESWARKQDPMKAVRFLVDLDGLLRDLAPRYKALEARADEVFWNSRVGGTP